ncbi:MAG: GNAT family N-acetyltransferase [Pseudomonadales bacterium]|nr:GNAT family N-acetyltransferase [Pseudomonadales bacterium]NRA17253.1 GNAT family N-acetyltransferase [Oceanospirillaceae bacterium]
MLNKAIIRDAKLSDLDDLIGLCQQHAQFELSAYNPAGKKQRLEEHLFAAGSTVQALVVELDRQLIGYATFIPQFSTWDAQYYLYLDCLFLNDKSRGKGLGEELIEAIKQRARLLECRLIQWQTPEFNTRAIKFYQRIGATAKSKQRFFLSLEN